MKNFTEDFEKSRIRDYISGNCENGYELFGPIRDEDFYIFRLYAPNANKVFIKGDFNSWTKEELYKDQELGYFFKKIKAKVGDYYKYVIEAVGNEYEHMDPFAKQMDQAPEFASKIVEDHFEFKDQKWLEKKTKNFDRPLNIYELHVGSWKRYGDRVNFLDIVDSLISHVKKMNYTHVEIMPVTEYPYYPSWGYQVSGFFATSSRFGSMDDLKEFINLLHQNDIGVILDFVVVHYANDYYGLKYFDSSPLYESVYPDLQYSEWGSLNFDYSKGHVRSFMKSAIDYWVSQFHLDGIRLDAISNMLYYGGDENRGVNYDNINFLKDLNQYLDEKYPYLMKIAEDSSAFDSVTKKIDDGGIGFDYKWDLGWMNDTIGYFQTDSIDRHKEQKRINFSMHYFYNENFILPLSHDEVVHLKNPMIKKMNGVYEDKFKQLKVLNMYQMTHPGKKLNFMGNEIATFDEWDENSSINWDILKYPMHDDFKRFIKDLNKLYKDTPAFYKYDFDKKGFLWKVVDDNKNSVFAYERISDKERFLVVLNMTNVYQKEYSIGFDEDIVLSERLNSLDKRYGNYRCADRIIRLKRGEDLKLELWQYEAVVFEIKEYGK